MLGPSYNIKRLSYFRRNVINMGLNPRNLITGFSAQLTNSISEIRFQSDVVLKLLKSIEMETGVLKLDRLEWEKIMNLVLPG